MADWHPVLRARKLGRKPVRVMLQGQALVLFRTERGIAALRDMCPHRAASLSGGRVVGGEVECPYHGWRFNGEGRCTHIPLHEGEVPRRFVPRWEARESHGLIFVTRDAALAGPIPLPVWDGQPSVQVILESEAVATVADACENVLDPVHTLFVHKGLIRSGSGGARVTMQARIERGELVMRYQGEVRQDGLLSRLLEPDRDRAVQRLRRPGTVSLEYWGKTRLSLVTTLYFTETAPERIRGFAVMTGPRQGGLGWLKAVIFLAIMRKVIAQDLAIMRDATENWLAAGRPKHAASPLDMLRPMIERVLEGETGDVPPEELTLRL